LLTKLKGKVQSWLKNGAESAHRLGLTPNQISTVGLAFAFSSAFFYANWREHSSTSLFLAAIFLLLSGFCDAFDGVLARVCKMATPFGGFMDSLADRYADALVLCGIIIGGLCNFFWGLLALTGSLLVSYVRAKAEAAGIVMESVGFAERAERILILAFSTFLALFWLDALFWAVLLLSLITNLTVLQRGVYFYKKTR